MLLLTKSNVAQPNQQHAWTQAQNQCRCHFDMVRCWVCAQLLTTQSATLLTRWCVCQTLSCPCTCPRVHLDKVPSVLVMQQACFTQMILQSLDVTQKNSWPAASPFACSLQIPFSRCWCLQNKLNASITSGLKNSPVARTRYLLMSPCKVALDWLRHCMCTCVWTSQSWKCKHVHRSNVFMCIERQACKSYVNAFTSIV